MKRSLAHLPKHKQHELIELTSIIKVNPGVEMVILFGSYARGNWVEDTYTEGHITYEYKSDFDILVIVKNRQYARRIMTWDKVKSAINNSRTINTWATVIVHDIAEMNKALSRGRYFFTDIKKEGVLLYDSKRYKLEKAQKLSSEERKQIAQEDYRNWSKSAREFLTSFADAFKRRHYNIAAFLLHQATERLYTTTLLVFTHYKAKEHSIKKLGKQVSNLDPRFLPVFPHKTPEERRLFELLEKAYIDARYNRNYKVTKKELEYLAERVKKLQQLTKEICKARIESYI
ncbi:MAG: HEPN domain-containing protein [Blastocatellia bacterium]